MNTITKAAISEIRRRHPNAKTTGFFSTLRAALWKTINLRRRSEDFLSEAEFRQDWTEIYRPGFMPDLFDVDCDTYLITLYEIEDTHPIDDGKMWEICEWWFTLDDRTDWDVRLFVTDRYGQGEREIPIPNVYFEFLGIDPASASAKQVAKEAGIHLLE